jgi:hypothetical protein
MSEPQRNIRQVDLRHLGNMTYGDWRDSDFQKLADMLEDRFVFVHGRWREWKAYFGNDFDLDHPHVLVIGEAVSRHHQQNSVPPENEYLIPFSLLNGDQWGLQVRHLEEINRLRLLPLWVQEVELCWWRHYHPGKVETPNHIKSRLDVSVKIGPHSRGYPDMWEAIDHSKRTYSLATFLGDEIFAIQSDITGQGIDELKGSYLRDMVKSLRLSDKYENELIESYIPDRDGRSSRHHGFKLLQNPDCLDLIEDSINTAENDPISGRPYGVTFAGVLSQAAREHAPACLARSMSDGELESWRSDAGLSQYASIISKEVDRRATDSLSAGPSSSSARRG